jgi:hypothetical protein
MPIAPMKTAPAVIIAMRASVCFTCRQARYTTSPITTVELSV